jgi:hypothetical protein
MVYTVVACIRVGEGIDLGELPDILSNCQWM